jgi:hypothetical protein
MSDGAGPLTQAQALALLARTTDQGWFAGMQASPDGQAILAALTAPLAEASLAVHSQVAACAIATAPAGRPGQCDLYLSRSASATAFTIPRGFTFVDSRGVRLAVSEDVHVSVGQTVIYLHLITIRQVDLLDNTEPAFDDLLSVGADAVDIVAPESAFLATRRFRIEAAAAAVDLYYDLSLAPPSFWDRVRSDGGDIRVKTAAGVDCAREVSAFNQVTRTGALFIATAGATAFWIYYGGDDVEPAPASALGRYSAWEAAAKAIYHLEDLSDSTAGGHDGASATPPAVCAGKLNAGQTFDGVAADVVVPDAPDLRPAQATLVAWFRSNGAQPPDTYFTRLLSKTYTDGLAPPYTSLGLVFRTSGLAIAAMHSAHNGNPDTSLAYATFTADQWHCVAMTFDGSTARIYMDGVLHALQGGLGAIAYSTGELVIGQTFASTPLGRYNGQLDEVRVYSRALDATEIATMFDNQNEPMAFWSTEAEELVPFNEAGFTYVSSTPIVGADGDWLSAHGLERGCNRQPGEDGEAYRLRVRAIPDAATPRSIHEAVHGAQAQADLPTVFMVEPMMDQASDVARAALDLVFADSLFFDEGFLDDPLGVDLPGKLPWRACEMPGLREARAYFRLGVAGELLEPDGSVWYWDAGFFDDSEWGFFDSGMHPTLVAALRTVQEAARVKVAAGVQFDTYVECVQQIDLSGEAYGLHSFTVSAPPGTAWLLRDGLVTVTSSGEPVNPALDSYRVILTLATGELLVSNLSRACDGIPLRTFELERMGYRSELVAQITVRTQAFGPAHALRAIGTFWVTPVTL